MKPEPMNIAVSVSKYYLPYTYVMLHSLLKNNACPINVYILHRELCPADFDFLRTLTHTASACHKRLPAVGGSDSAFRR